MRTLTEVFAPGAPPLPEGLRTLVVSPERTVEPGTTVRATFAFYNMGGAPATGLRVRFSMPEGMRYLAGSARIDDVAIEETRGETSLLATNGADIGEVPPGVERRISLSYLVAPTIENGAVIRLQAALASVELGVIGSNIVELGAKSAPDLQSSATFAALEALREPAPGEEIRVVGRVQNSGQSSAHDVVVVVPIPDWTTYVAGSARIDGREVSVDERGDPFGFAHAPVAAATLSPGATLQVEYRARIVFPLDNGTRLYVHGAVASSETPEFELPRAELVVRAAARFEGTESRLDVDADGEVEPGRRLRIELVAANTGTCAADDVAVRLTLPGGVRYAPGSRAIDGRSIGEAPESGDFRFERIPAGGRVTASLEAYVVSPALDGTQLTIGGHLAWSTGTRSFERTLTIRSLPRFLPERNTLEIVGSNTVVPGKHVRFAVRVANDGTTGATDARLLLLADAELENLRYTEVGGAETRIHNGTIDLGRIDPGTLRDLALVATLVEPLADRSEIRLAAVLDTAELGRIPLGTVTLVARSRPRFTPASSRLTILTHEPLRPDRAGDIAARVENEGTDIARDVRVSLELSADARIESVDGATRDGSTLIFGDVPAGGSAEARVRIRLARFVARGTTVSVEARLSGVGLLPFLLDPIAIPTLAEPSFAQDASLRTQPADAIDAGEAMFFQFVLRNTGDGTASRLVISAPPAPHTAYVPGTTTINEVALLDVGGTSILWSPDGLVLEEVSPGTEIVVRWCAIVNTPLPAGTLIEAEAEAQWDGGGETSVSAPAVRVRSTPAFAVRALGLPFSVAGVAPLVRDTPRTPAILEPPASVPPGFAQGVPRALPVPQNRTIEAPINVTPDDVTDAAWRHATPAEAWIGEPPSRTREMEIAEERANAASRAAEEAQRLAEDVLRAAAEMRAAEAVRAAEARRAAELHEAEEARRVAEIERLEEERRVERERRFELEARALEQEKRRAEELHALEEERHIEAERQAEELRRLEEERRAEATRQAEELRRLEEERRHQAARQAEELRLLEEQRRLEAERRAEELRLLEVERQLEVERRALAESEADRLRTVADELRRESEAARLAAEARAEEERRLQAERLAETERLSEEAERLAAEARLAREGMTAAEVARAELEAAVAEARAATEKAIADALAAEAAAEQTRLEEGARQAEERRAAHEAQAAAETALVEARAAAEAARAEADSEMRAAADARSALEAALAEARAADEARASEEARATESARVAAEAQAAAEAAAAEARQAEEARRAEEARAADEARAAAEARAAFEAAASEARHAAEEARLLAEARRAEEARAESEARAAEAARLAAEAAVADARAAEARAAEAAAREAQLTEEARAAEEARRAAEAAREAAEARVEEEARAAVEAAVAEARAAEARAAEATAREAQLTEEARAAEEARRAAEAAREAAEARAEEEARAAAEARSESAARAAAIPASPAVVLDPHAGTAVGIVSFPPEKLERTLRFIEQAAYGGLITHLFVVRSLLPETIVGVGARDLQGRIDAQRGALRNIVDRLFIKMRLPRYSLTAKDLEDRSARESLLELVQTFSDVRPSTPPQTLAGIRIVGPLDLEAINAQAATLESEPLGSAKPWTILAQMLGSSLEWDGDRSPAVGDYREALISTLGSVSALPISEFHRVLTTSSNAALDNHLEELKAALRRALETAVTVADRG